MPLLAHAFACPRLCHAIAPLCLPILVSSLLSRLAVIHPSLLQLDVSAQTALSGCPCLDCVRLVISAVWLLMFVCNELLPDRSYRVTILVSESDEPFLL